LQVPGCSTYPLALSFEPVGTGSTFLGARSFTNPENLGLDASMIAFVGNAGNLVGAAAEESRGIGGAGDFALPGP
jgi:hypothetical protein